jgi:hypothetical protein
MDWKQPEGLRRHWTLEELDTELLFLQNPVNAAQGRVVDDVYDLRDGGILKKRRTLAANGAILATLEEVAPNARGSLLYNDTTYTWKSTNLMGTRWSLIDPAGQTHFTFVTKPGLAKVAKVELGPAPPETVGLLILLCWYATVL